MQKIALLFIVPVGLSLIIMAMFLTHFLISDVRLQPVFPQLSIFVSTLFAIGTILFSLGVSIQQGISRDKKLIEQLESKIENQTKELKDMLKQYNLVNSKNTRKTAI